MLTGRVKWFSEAKGYGFLQAPGVKGDVFVHYSAIDNPGFKTLRDHSAVVFELESGGKGLVALHVKSMDPNDDVAHAKRPAEAHAGGSEVY